jgi:sigma-B regulation protein RsbU (phosphoserine phosphatase)
MTAIEFDGVFDKELKVPASIDELDRVLAWIEEALENENCSAKASNHITVVTEELFVNIARYAYDGQDGDVVIRLAARGPAVIIRFEDWGKEFNPLNHPKPDTSAGIEERKIGGLGLFLTVKWMDNVSYERTDDKNILTLQKRLREENSNG